MPLGTLDRTPPPFFKQGPSARTQLVFFAALALFLMVADTRFKLTQPLRSAMAAVLHPVERVLLVPVQAIQAGYGYAAGLQQAVQANDDAQRRLAAQSERALRVEQLVQENAQLRGLLGLRAALPVRSQAAEILYEAADPYTRKVVIDRGAAQGVLPASPVLVAEGVLGQVTRVYPLNAEVTLLTDKDAAIPVLNGRTQGRAAAYGDPSTATAGGGMELRFMAGNADIEVDDPLFTSGVDGIYPPGLAVAKVQSVDRRGGTMFAKVTLTPATRPDGVRHVLVLEPLSAQMPARPAEFSASAPAPAASSNRVGGRR